MTHLKHLQGAVKHILSTLVLLALAACTAPDNEHDSSSLYRVTSSKSVDEIIADLEVVVSEHNFAIVARHPIGRVARRNGRPDFPEVTVLHVCNIDYAIKILDVSLENAINLPCRIAIFEADDKVVLQARLFSESNDELRPVAREINTALRAILDFAAD